ncbi:phosphate signaling complex protein PhoU [Geomicrobium sp. JSM 1781026]
MYKMKYFHQEMRKIEKQLYKMGVATKVQMERVPTALFSKDEKHATQLISEDETIDRFDQQVHTDVLNLIMLQPPLPHELRVLTSMMRVARELERMGDQIVNIAEIAKERTTDPKAQFNSEKVEQAVREMNHISLEMMSHALSMMKEQDYQDYDALEQQDEHVDALFYTMQKQLSTEMKQDPLRIDSLAPFFLVARYQERIADHVVNIVRKLKESQEEGVVYGLDSD